MSTALQRLKERQEKRSKFFAERREKERLRRGEPKPKLPPLPGLITLEEWLTEMGSAFLTAAAPERQACNRRFAKYGMSYGEAEHRLFAQGGVCPICQREIDFDEKDGKPLAVVDHCHEAEQRGEMRVRGVLCSSCNLAEGLYQSDPVRHLRGALYLLSNHYPDPGIVALAKEILNG